MKTFENQKNVPPLPVPDLKTSCDNFISWSRPILTEEERLEVEEKVTQFLANDGPTLQKRLLDWSAQNKESSWLEPFWEDMYLSDRNRIMVDSNFALVLERTQGMKGLSQLEMAVALTRSAVKLKRMIETETLEPTVEKGTPICMVQMKNLFSTSRIPQKKRDHRINAYLDSNACPSFAKHILVLRNGHLFLLKVCDDMGEPLGDPLLTSGFLQIMEGSHQSLPVEQCLASLTTWKRENWAESREALRGIHPRNRELLDNIDKALFSITLDDSEPVNLTEAMKIALHSNGQNGWYDKSFQLTICKNGKWAINPEHSGTDGDTINQLVHALVNIPKPTNGNTKITTDNIAQPINFDLDSKVQNEIKQSYLDYREFVENLRITVLENHQFGVDKIKSLRISPDGFLQAALHATQYQVFGECRSTYESVMMKHFLHGRTDCMRSVTPEAVSFAKKMGSPVSTLKEKAAALRESAKAHVDRINILKSGQGMERHLFGLFHIYQRFGKELGIHQLPSIYNSKAWQKMRTDILSTSIIGKTPALALGYGPTSKNGFGIGYLTGPELITFTIVAKGHMEKEWRQFRRILSRILPEMVECLEHN
ncbi:MAG: choline/carnitine O-acyltransferase [Proteobacteria bacterium]|nr:choline/carnitine O-acyltransferase [Pseudomonadota bacterium]